MTDYIRAWIPGKPVPCPRPRVSKHGTYYPPAYVAWKDIAKALMRNAVVKARGGRMLTGRVRVRVEFCGAHGSADLDNLVKSVLDAAQGVVFENDRQVWALEASKQDGEGETRVDVWELG